MAKAHDSDLVSFLVLCCFYSLVEVGTVLWYTSLR